MMITQNSLSIISFLKNLFVFPLAVTSLSLSLTSIFFYYCKFIIKGYSHASSSYSSFEILFFLGIVLFPICFSNLTHYDKTLCKKLVTCIYSAYFFATHIVFTNIITLPALSVYRIFRTGLNITCLSYCLSIFPTLRKHKEPLCWLSLFSLLVTGIFMLSTNNISIFARYFFDFNQFKLVQSLFIYSIATMVYTAYNISKLNLLKLATTEEDASYESNQ